MLTRGNLLVLGWTIFFGLFFMLRANGQSISQAYDRFKDLSSLFTGSVPYSSLAIVDVSYEGSGKSSVRDTSTLIYRDRQTYYKSTRVERLEGGQGVLIINHELQSATLEISDSLRQVILEELAVARDSAFESMLDSNFRQKDEEAFRDFILHQCHYHWKKDEGVQEISFWPKSKGTSGFESIVLRFDPSRSRVLYYSYSVRDAYARDLEGRPLYRLVSTIYEGFNYDQVPRIPNTLDTYLEWEGWSVQLKKYRHYKFSLL